MYKIAGELTPAVIHGAARTLATHALSIFGDHSDVMAALGTGWSMVCASSVQEAHDFTAIAHAATLNSRVPFLHFFDGLRTSHQIERIQVLADEDLRALVDEAAVADHRGRGLSPDAPTLRGTAQNPDVFFQARGPANRFHDAVPDTVQDLFDDFAVRTERRYPLVDYVGAPDAEEIIVLMGSGAGAVAETVEELVARGRKVGLCTIRLYRPFPAAQRSGVLPPTVRRLMALDRTKEPGSVGDPLYTDVLSALAEEGRMSARHRLKGPGPRPCVGSERQHPGPRHRSTPTQAARLPRRRPGPPRRSARRAARRAPRRIWAALHLHRTEPERSESLLAGMQQDADERWAHYVNVAADTRPT